MNEAATLSIASGDIMANIDDDADEVVSNLPLVATADDDDTTGADC